MLQTNYSQIQPSQDGNTDVSSRLLPVFETYSVTII